jgi:protein-L-isoaspartate(D-aspartate) O-methyltransferase
MNSGEDSRAQKMVERDLVGQIRDERVLEAMRRVPRHFFVPESQQDSAYDNRPLGIGYGQTISQPLMVAIMLEALALQGTERVLEVGTGSGYQAALLAELAAEVYSVDIVGELISTARAALERAGAHNVEVEERDGSLGWPEKAPFDAIIVAAGAPDCPTELKNQLAIGGRLVIPVGPLHGQILDRIQRDAVGFTTQHLTACAFVPLRGRRGWHRRY